MTTVTAGERMRPLTSDELAPLLLQEEARENLYNKSHEKAPTMKNKGSTGKPKGGQPSSNEDKAWKKNIKVLVLQGPRTHGKGVSQEEG